jgi:hypothetical protein
MLKHEDKEEKENGENGLKVNLWTCTNGSSR